MGWAHRFQWPTILDDARRSGIDQQRHLPAVGYVKLDLIAKISNGLVPFTSKRSSHT